jgi:hypothetical protein
MQLSHGGDDEQWAPLAANFRGGGKQYRTLIAGSEGAPDNYRLVLVRQTGKLHNPRHKHNFDQLRLCIDGRINYGRDRWIEPGEIAYFPEGTSYGPEICDCDRLGVTIQFGGASGAGFMSERQTQLGVEALQQVGKFADGVFSRSGETPPGERRNQDAYEAIWERVNGRRLAYPSPRYDEPVLMRPGNFEFLPEPGQSGLATKLLGVFGGRRLEIALLRLTARMTAMLAPRPGIRLGFVLAGAGRVEDAALRRFTAFELEADRGATLAAQEELHLLLVGLPIFAAGKIGIAA